MSSGILFNTLSYNPMLVYFIAQFFHFCPLEALSVDSCDRLPLSGMSILGGVLLYFLLLLDVLILYFLAQS